MGPRSDGTVELTDGSDRYIPVETDIRSQTWRVVTVPSDPG